MKKLISVFIVCFLVLSTFPLSSLAEEPVITITSPADGAKISALTAVEADVNVSADYVIVRLDGKEIGNAVPSEGEIFYEIGDALSIGFHTVDVIAVGEGISAIASSTFNIIYPYEVDIYDETMDNAPQIETVTAQSAGDVIIGSATSHDGSKALAFNVPEGVTTKGKAFITFGGTYSGPAVIEVDMFLGTSCNMKIETKNKKNGWGSMFRSAIDQYVFDRSGNIMSGADTKIGKAYVTKEWCRIKIEGDFSKGICSMSIGKFDSEGNVTYEPIFVNESLGEAFIDIVQIRFEFAALTYFTEYAEKKIIGIDNLKVTQKKEVAGFTDISFPDGTSQGVSKVRLAGASQFKTSDFLPYISAYVDESEVEVTSATADGDNLDITFKKAIGTQKDVKIVLDKDIPVESKITCPSEVEYSFKTEAPPVCISGAEYKANGAAIYSHQQIKAGTALECVFNFNNASSDAKSVVLLAALYKGDEMIDFEYLPYEIAVGSSQKSVTLTLPSEYTDTDYSIEMFAVNSFAESIPLSKMWRIAK